MRIISNDNLTSYNKSYYDNNKEIIAKRNKNASRTKLGLISNIFKTQKRTTIKRNDKYGRNLDMPNYTKQEFVDWVMSKDLFHKLYNNWVESNYSTNLRPSVDRINSKISYCFSNIQIMTWQDNNEKGRIEKFKPILQYTLNGKFIREYNSILEASIFLNIKYKKVQDMVYKNIQKSKLNYKFIYKNEK